MARVHYGWIEAEDFQLGSSWTVVGLGAASNGAYVQPTTSGTVSMSAPVMGVPGVYDIRVWYFDENDGASTTTLRVDGQAVDTWTWSRNLGSSMADVRTLTSHTIRNVTLDDAATITISGARNGGESLRIDKIELMPPADRAGPGGLPSFPGAEGFGATTPGGRGGWIVKVTTLADSGVGSLRWALQELDAPRIVVFEVGGIIDLRSDVLVRGDVTVAGQTAPGDGVTLRGGRLRIIEDDVIIRGLKIRPGDGPGIAPDQRDGISIGDPAETVERIVIDSNSLTWAIDENLAVWNAPRDVTISRNIIAQGLDESIHPEGRHSMGLLIGDNATRVTVVDNLFAHNAFRSPAVFNARSVEVVNNLVYNYSHWGTEASPSGGSVSMHLIGNRYIAGPDSSRSNPPVHLMGAASTAQYHVHDNLGLTRGGDADPQRAIASVNGAPTLSASPVFATSGVTARSARDVEAWVLAHAGARANGLDATDRQIVDSVVNRNGSIIDRPSEAGGYRSRTVFAGPRDTDGDGIPDSFEDLLGFDKFVFDPHRDDDRDGYTNIEEYINGLITGFDVGGGGGSGGGAGSPGQTFAIEAEAMTLSNLRSVSNAHASGGRFVEAASTAEARASLRFGGASGVYDVGVTYFDENDGVSRLALVIDGATVASWSWSQDRGSAHANAATRTMRVIENVSIANGATVALVGFADGAEPLRIDRIDIGPDGFLL